MLTALSSHYWNSCFVMFFFLCNPVTVRLCASPDNNYNECFRVPVQNWSAVFFLGLLNVFASFVSLCVIFFLQWCAFYSVQLCSEHLWFNQCEFNDIQSEWNPYWMSAARANHAELLSESKQNTELWHSLLLLMSFVVMSHLVATIS